MDQKEVLFIGQKQLAKRWSCSQGTIIEYRKRGILKYFRLPGSSKILYRLEDIEALERQYTQSEGGDKPKQVKPEKKGKPVVSENPEKAWRI